MENANQESLLKKFKENLAKEFFEIERNEQLSKDEKISKIISSTSVICAAIAIQPIPFADIFILTPIQAYMGHKIAQIHGLDLKEEGTLKVMRYLGGVVGIGFAAQQTVIGLYKIGLPGIGGLMTIPLVAGLTYGIGRSMNVYFAHKAVGDTPSNSDIINAFKLGKKEGKKIDLKEVKNKAGEISG